MPRKPRPAATYSPELTEKLERALRITTETEGTVILIFTDMFEVNEHFQATLDWFKAKGNGLRKDKKKGPARYGNGAFLEKGMLYFVGKDTHVTTRGVQEEIDMTAEEHELVRQVGLEARLRKKEEEAASA